MTLQHISQLKTGTLSHHHDHFSHILVALNFWSIAMFRIFRGNATILVHFELWAKCPVQRNGVKIVKSQRSIFEVQAKVKTVNYSRLSTTWKISIIYFKQPSEKIKTILNFPQLSSSSRAGDEHSPRCLLLGVHDDHHYVFWCFCQ